MCGHFSKKPDHSHKHKLKFKNYLWNHEKNLLDLKGLIISEESFKSTKTKYKYLSGFEEFEKSLFFFFRSPKDKGVTCVCLQCGTREQVSLVAKPPSYINAQSTLGY